MLEKGRSMKKMILVVLVMGMFQRGSIAADSAKNGPESLMVRLVRIEQMVDSLLGSRAAQDKRNYEAACATVTALFKEDDLTISTLEKGIAQIQDDEKRREVEREFMALRERHEESKREFANIQVQYKALTGQS